MVDRTSDSGKQSGTLQTSAFFTSLVTESKKRSLAAKSRALLSLDGSINRSTGDSFIDGLPICWTLIFRSISLFDTSKALSINGTGYVLVGIRGCKGFLGTTVQR